ncbi:ImmA/IrrE family metallo-endopeptidase [Paenibacillus gansuensis]|uniref:ImmA/IrrE family metallo-endopeptidase n=1 Tax=Paenibacillus gansuensis TaxID=306542 RepID=A0ABW5PIX9_9BACL
MNLKYYKPTQLEQWISNVYQKNGINYASDLDLERICDIFGINLQYYTGPSCAKWADDYSFIFLNSYLCTEQRREVFFHELCHPLKHVGNQRELPELFKQLQENQAAQLQMYAAIPAYMLEEFNGITSYSAYIKVLSEEFLLPTAFIVKRVEQIQRRIYQAKQDRQLRIQSKTIQLHFGYSPETMRILNQLEKQLAKTREIV